MSSAAPLRVPPVPVAPPSRVSRVTFDRLVVFLLFLALLGAACLMPAQSDTFWQLRAGAETVATGKVQLADTFTHTVRGAYWPNHEWASEVAFYALHALGGFPLLTLTLATFVVLSWALTWKLMRGPAIQRAVLVGVFGVCSARLWSLRPQVISLFLLAAAMTLLIRRREAWLIPLFALWANLHGGVVLGFAAIAGAMSAALVIEPSRWRWTSALLVSCMASACLSPLGSSLWTEVPDMLHRLREYQVAEWQRTSLVDPWNLPFWASCAAVPLLTWKHRRRLDVEDAFLVGASFALLVLGIRTTRNVMPALMLSAPVLSRLFTHRHGPSRPARREKPVLNCVVAAAAALTVIFWVGISWARGVDRLRWTPMSADAMRAVGTCRPSLYNLYDDGGFIEWLVPAQPVFVDSRQDPFPPALVRAQIEAESTGDYRSLFTRFDVHCAALPPRSRVAARLKADGWRVVHESPRWVVIEQPF